VSDLAQVVASVTDLCRSPDGPRDRQLLYGDHVEVLSRDGAWCHVQAHKDGYRGHLRQAALGPAQEATHWVSAAASHRYAAPDFKSPELGLLTLGSRITVLDASDRFAETPDGFVPRVHLTPLSEPATDPAAVAALLIGTAYLWGGNSRSGIDCSGLVQAALLACGIPCPGDSGQQEQEVGRAVTDRDYRRNDLLFWKGHVALVTAADTMVHANAHHMAVAYEPIDTAIQRIAAQGDGPVTGHRRIEPGH
jgi:hypothetical protein